MENEENKVENPVETPENPPETPENPPKTPENPPEAPGNPDETPENPPETPEGPGWIAPERLESLLAYCKLSELREDPEVMALIRELYSGRANSFQDAKTGGGRGGAARGGRAAHANL